MSSLTLLLSLKARMAWNAFGKLRKKSPLEMGTLTVFLLGAGGVIFGIFYHSFSFFQAQKPFGPILIDESFYLFNFMLFIMLLISSGISAYTSLFRSQEIPFLLTKNTPWRSLYFMKMAESLWLSSWQLLFLIIPFIAAFSLTRGLASGTFPFFCFLFYLPFVFLTVGLGNFFAVLCVALFPSPKSRKFALMITIAVVLMLFFKSQPQIIREQGSLSGILTGYLPHIALAKQAFLPSCWITRGILAFCQIGSSGPVSWHEGLFYFQILIANLLFLSVPSLAMAEQFFPRIYLKAQDHGSYQARRLNRSHVFKASWMDRMPASLSAPFAFLEKDIKTFMRDPSDWSQLLIFFGLILIYFLNLRSLHFDVLQELWRNIIFVLNMIGTFIVLSSFSMRCIFPLLSMEGNRVWILFLAPVSFGSLLAEKFILGTILSLILTLPLVFLSGWMLHIEPLKILWMTGLGIFGCMALTGLSVGLGALFPNFKTNNPSQIISGLGGSLVLVTHLVYLAGLGIFLFLVHQPGVLTFILMAGISLIVAFLPLRMGWQHWKHLEP